MDWATKFDKHSDLFNRMSDTLHLNVAREVVEGRMQGSEIRGRIIKCMTCSAADACESFLETHSHGAEHAPDYCQNIDLFERVREIA